MITVPSRHNCWNFTKDLPVAAEIILITVTFLLAWTYVIYPAAGIVFARLKRNITQPHAEQNEKTPLPYDVMMSLHIKNVIERR
jgi:hypothetical protein